MNNIYYVGRRNHSPTQRHPRNIEQTHMHRHSARKSTEQSSVSSCRKTQPKYLHLKRKRQETNSPQRKVQFHTNNICSSPRGDSYRVVVKRNKKSDKEECSGIQMQPLKFNRVQQPPRHLNLMTIMKNESNRSTQRKCEKPSFKPNIVKQQEAQKNTEKIVDKIVDEQMQSQYSQLAEIYKIQPKRKLFLCSACLLYLPYIEINSHHMQCRSPKTPQDYIQRWKLVSDLLIEIHRAHPSNDQLFRLCELMDSYPSSRKNKQESPSIYSQQLERILRYKLIIFLQQLNNQDLFWTIQTLGDKVETTKMEKTRWILCS